MVTEAENNLIRLLKSCGLSKEATVGIVVLAGTAENRERLIQAIIARHDKYGTVTEEEILKMLLILVGKRKEPDSTSTMED